MQLHLKFFSVMKIYTQDKKKVQIKTTQGHDFFTSQIGKYLKVEYHSVGRTMGNSHPYILLRGRCIGMTSKEEKFSSSYQI